MERPKYPQRSINYASGDFALSALSTKFSLDLAANTILGNPPQGTGGIVPATFFVRSLLAALYDYINSPTERSDASVMDREQNSRNGHMVIPGVNEIGAR